MPRVIDPFFQFFDDAGDPLVNGWLRFTVSGTNNTDKDTFADSSETIANTNPVQLDGAGRCPNVFGSGSYRVTSFANDELLGAPGTQIQQFDPVGGTFGTGDFSDWNSESIYSVGDIVKYDGVFYRSLQNNNQGVQPPDGDFWYVVSLNQEWNDGITYAEGDIVIAVDGYAYISTADGNLSNDPTASPTMWESLSIREWNATTTYKTNDIVRRDGILVASQIDNNVNNDPATDLINWAAPVDIVEPAIEMYKFDNFGGF